MTAGTPAPAGMMQLLYSGLVANLVSAVAELGVADLLDDGPRSVTELATGTGADPDALYRALRALSTAGVFAEVEPRRFGLTPMAATLRTGAPGSMRDHARNWGRPGYQHAFTAIGYSLRTGRPAFEHVFGTDWWSYLDRHPEDAEAFNRAMGNRARQVVAAAAAAFDLSDVGHVVDVGGGHGQLLAALLDRYPHLTGTVFDLPDVVVGAAEALAGHGDRAATVGGSFFEEVPGGGDVYLLSGVLHDWDDRSALAILSTVRKALHPDARVLVLDVVLDERDPAPTGALLDVAMLALVSGRERTESEFAALFAGAGLRHVGTVATASPVSLVIGAVS